MKNTLFKILFMGFILGGPQFVFSQQCAESFGELSEEKLHAIVANICALDTILEREQVAYGKNEGASFQHRWQILETQKSFEIRGVCTQLMDFHSGRLLPGHDLKLHISKETFRSESNPSFSGKLGAVQVKIHFKDKSFYDPDCEAGTRIVKNRRLESLQVGVGLFDIIKRGRTLLQSYSVEQSWDGLGESPVSLDFRAAQFNGRQNRFITSFDGQRNILLKVGLYLFKEEGASEFTYSYEKANHVFLNEGFSSLRGCSVLKNNSEFSIPAMVTTQECQELLELMN